MPENPYRVSVQQNGVVTVNGVAIHRENLADRLAGSPTAPSDPGIIFEPHSDASYQAAFEVMAAIQKSPLVPAGFCFGGLAQHAEFKSSAQMPRLNLTIAAPEKQSFEPLPRTELPNCGDLADQAAANDQTQN